MKKVLVILSLLIVELVYAQAKETSDVVEIKKVMSVFMESIAKKDSIRFYGLFHEDPIVWIGVFREKTKQAYLQSNAKAKPFFSSTYKEFFRGISVEGTFKEEFYNVKIDEDGSVASVSFDYSFWMNNQKTNWGKENWSLIKVNNSWKITSVLFSMDYESINPEPANRKSE